MGMKIGQIAHKECVFSQPFIILVFVYDQLKQGRLGTWVRSVIYDNRRTVVALG